MTKIDRCPHCGNKLPPDAINGVCPECLMKAGLASESNVTIDMSKREGPGTKIGHYELLELIGEGGMGLVYLAEQKEPVRRKVVLKIIKPGMDSKQIIARFEVERQVLAILDNPNIAHVFDAGTTETGRPYFVMEYVKGLPITRYCDEHKLNIEQRMRLFEKVCEGIHHAHQKGIIHRDIKPSNILVSVHDDNAVPKIIDFGIAKAMTHPLTEKTFYTSQGQLLGTPEYMSPEQVDLATQDIDTRSDIYSLGVVLYELLAGVLPFDEESFGKRGLADIQRTIREIEPATPSKRLTSLGEKAKTIAASRSTQVIPLARRLHRELEWIPLKAMRKERCRRYKSASDMAEDIRNYLNGNPLIAGPETAIYRVKKFVYKYAGSVATAAVIAIAIILGLVVSTTMYLRAEEAKKVVQEQRNVAEEQRGLAEQARKNEEKKAEEYRRSLYVKNINLAERYYFDDNASRMRDLLRNCPEDLRRWEWDYLWRMSDKSLKTLQWNKGLINRVLIDPLASNIDGSRIVTGGEDGTIRIWDSESGKELMPPLIGHTGIVRSVAFSHDSSRIVSGGEDGAIRIWDAATGELIRSPLEGHDLPIWSVAFNHDGSRIVSGSGDGTIRIWDAESGEELLPPLTGHGGIVSSVAFSPDGERIVSGSWDRTIRIWDSETGKELMPPLIGHTWRVTTVTFSPDGRRIVSGCGWLDPTIIVWDANDGNELFPLEGHKSGVISIAFSHDGSRIVSGSRDTTIKVWDAETGGELLTLMGHEDIVGLAMFSPDDERIVSASGDNTLKIWNTESISEAMILNGHEGPVDWIVFSPTDDKRMLSGSYDGTLKLWDTESASEVMTFWGHVGFVHSVAFSPDGKRIVSGCNDGTIKIWDAESGIELRTLEGHEGVVDAVAFSPNGSRIASSSNNTLKVWDANSGDLLHTFEATNQLANIAFSPDGRRIVSGNRGGGLIEVWDAITYKNDEPLMTLPGYSEAVVFSPDGSKIVSGGWLDGIIRIWDANSGDELMALRGHNGNLFSIVFDPNGKRIVSGSLDGTVRVWDVTTGEELVTLQAESAVLGVAFSPDANTIAAARQHDYAIMLWDSKLTDSEFEARKIGIAATKLVDELHEKHEYYKDVITQLNTDSTLDEQTRKIALQVANSRLYEDYVKDANEIVDQLYQEHGSYYEVVNELQVDKTIDESILEYVLKIADFRKRIEAIILNNESWPVVRLPDNSIEEYQTALEKAQKANTSDPNNWVHLNGLGVAQYRVGDYEEALETLMHSDKILIELNRSSNPFNLAFIAMSQYKLDRIEDAKATLEQLRELCQEDLYSENLPVQAVLAEAQKLIEGE